MKTFLFAIFCLTFLALSQGTPVKIRNIEIHTEQCEDCGMLFAGSLSVKVCGNLNCCFTPWLTGNFDEGASDYFSGPSELGECNDFGFMDTDRNFTMAVTMFHQGVDAHRPDYLQVNPLDEDTSYYCDFDDWLNWDEYISSAYCRNQRTAN